MIERNGKFYVTLEFDDESAARRCEHETVTVWGCNSVDPVTSVHNSTNGPVSGMVVQTGTITKGMFR